MAKKMSFTGMDGVEHPESYWKVTDLNINHHEKRGQFTLTGWHNEQAKTDGRSPIAGAQHNWFITPDLYETYFAASAQNPDGENPQKAAYLLATNTPNVPSGSLGEQLTDFLEGSIDV